MQATLAKMAAVALVATLLNGCVTMAMLPVAAAGQAAMGAVVGVAKLATAGIAAAGAAGGTAAAGAGAAGAAEQAGTVTSAATDLTAVDLAAAVDAAPPAAQTPEPALLQDPLPARQPGGEPMEMALAPMPEPGLSTQPYLPNPDDDAAEDKAEDASRRTETHNGHRYRSGSASQCAQGPGFSACQQADMTGMAVAAVAGAVIITSLFRDGEPVGSTCSVKCGDTDISVSCPLPQEPLCQCGETPLAQCVDPKSRETVAAQAEPAAAPAPSVLERQRGK